MTVLAETLQGRKSLSRISIYFSKYKCCLFHDGNASNVWSSWGNMARHWLSVSLYRWSIGYAALEVTKLLLVSGRKPMFLSPHLISITVTMATLLMSPLGNDRRGWNRTLTGVHRMGHPMDLFSQIFLCWSHPLGSIQIRYKYLQTIVSKTSSPGPLVTNFPVLFLPSLWQFRQAFSHNLGITIDLYFRLCSNR